jgi:hypothetical protein
LTRIPCKPGIGSAVEELPVDVALDAKHKAGALEIKADVGAGVPKLTLKPVCTLQSLLPKP